MTERENKFNLICTPGCPQEEDLRPEVIYVIKLVLSEFCFFTDSQGLNRPGSLLDKALDFKHYYPQNIKVSNWSVKIRKDSVNVWKE